MDTLRLVNLVCLYVGAFVSSVTHAQSAFQSLPTIVTQPTRMMVQGDTLAVMGRGEIQLFDLADPLSPVPTGHLSGLPVGRMVFAGDSIVIAHGSQLSVVDVGNHANPVLLTDTYDLLDTTFSWFDILGFRTYSVEIADLSYKDGYWLLAVNWSYRQGSNFRRNGDIFALQRSGTNFEEFGRSGLSKFDNFSDMHMFGDFVLTTGPSVFDNVYFDVTTAAEPNFIAWGASWQCGSFGVPDLLENRPPIYAARQGQLYRIAVATDLCGDPVGYGVAPDGVHLFGGSYYFVSTGDLYTAGGGAVSTLHDFAPGIGSSAIEVTSSAIYTASSDMLFVVPPVAPPMESRLSRNPVLDLPDPSGTLRPTDLLSIAEFQSSPDDAFQPTSLTASGEFVFEQGVDPALIENAALVSTPPMSAAELGVVDAHSMPRADAIAELTERYFQMVPEADYVFTWVGDESSTTPFVGVVAAEPALLGPAGRCTNVESLDLSVDVSGAAGIGSGVVGIDIRGVVTQNQIRLFVLGRSVLQGDVFGHAWIELDNGTDRDADGMYPGLLGVGAVLPGFPGTLSDDGGSNDWSHKMTWLVPTSQFESARQKVEDFEGFLGIGLSYDLFDAFAGGPGYNCASWAVSILEAAGIEAPDGRSLGFFDPAALDDSISAVLASGMLFNDCGEPMRNGSPRSGSRGEGSRGASPVDYSVSAVLDGLMNDPVGLAASLDTSFFEGPSLVVGVGPDGVLGVEVLGTVGTAVVLWPSGTVQVSEVPGTVEQHANEAGSGTAQVFVFEDAGLHGVSVDLAVSVGGPPMATVSVAITDQGQVALSDNGPFTQTPIFDPADVTSCLTDCNANGIPDCDEGMPTLDCDGNGVLDACDLASGIALDTDGNLIPDRCQAVCTADVFAPFGEANIDDVLAFLSAFSAEEPLADLAEPNGVFDIDDVITFLTSFAFECP